MKRKKSIKGITMIELGLAGVLLVVLALLVYWYADGLSSYSPNALTYQCIGGQTIDYTEDVSFRNLQNNSVMADDTDGKFDAAETPILYKDNRKVTLSKDMLLMSPLEGTSVKRVLKFTTLDESGGKTRLSLKRKEAECFGGFLYDGIDQYIFLENITLEIGNNIIELPALSYVIVRYAQEVEYHNSETKENKVVGINELEIIATLHTSGNNLKLDKDIIEVNGQDTLLYSAVENIDVIEMD